MQFTASSPQYAFGSNMSPVPMMAGGGLASLPVRRFQSGGSTGFSIGTAPAPSGGLASALTSPMEGTPVVNTPFGTVGASPLAALGVVAPPQLSVPLSVLNATLQAYNYFTAKTAKQEPAPVTEATVDPYSPPPPGIPFGVPGTVSVEGISPGYSEPGRAQSVVDAMIATHQEEQAQAQAEAQAAQVAAQQAVDAVMGPSDPGAAATSAAAAAAAAATGGTGTGNDAGVGTDPGTAPSIGGSMDAGGSSNTGTDAGSEGASPSYNQGGSIQNYQYGGQVMNYAQGGLPSLANNMASKGRYGDSMMVHMSPEEVQGLQRLAMADGTSLSINPYTGMPEAFSLKRSLKKFAKFIAPILPFIPIPGLMGLSPLITKTLLSSVVGGLGGKKGFDFKRALTSGLTTYGIGSLAQGAGAAANASAGAPTSTVAGPSLEAASFEPGVGYVNAAGNPIPDVSTLTPDFTGGEKVFLDSAGNPVSSYAMPQADGSALAVSPQGAAPAPSTTGGFKTSLPEGSSFTDYVKQTGENIQTAGKGLYDTVTGAPGARAAFTAGQEINPFTDKPLGVGTAAGAAFTGVAGMKTLEELDKAKEQADKVLQDINNKNEEEKAYARKILAQYPIEYRRITGQDVTKFGLAMGGKINSYDDEIGGDDGMMQGGIAALAKGGLPPRYLRGGGDGMSDSIKANIDGKQEARLADGEFVVPADVVSHLGNGSSNAGAKKLYAMMDRVRRSRTGKTRQAPQVNTRSMMPA